jgi:hypothetical protein
MYSVASYLSLRVNILPKNKNYINENENDQFLTQALILYESLISTLSM